jgi:hypothetical protein
MCIIKFYNKPVTGVWCVHVTIQYKTMISKYDKKNLLYMMLDIKIGILVRKVENYALKQKLILK